MRISASGLIALTVLAAGLGPGPGERDGPAYAVLQVLNAHMVLAKVPGGPQIVRLRGLEPVDAVANRAYQALAYDHLRGLLDGQAVRLERAPGSPKAFLYRESDGALVNLEVVRQGYAQARPDLPESRREAFQQAERAAREAGLGLWAEGATADHDRAQEAIQKARSEAANLKKMAIIKRRVEWLELLSKAWAGSEDKREREDRKNEYEDGKE
jgi:endonuclease YncB( thermonuclease family)